MFSFFKRNKTSENPSAQQKSNARVSKNKSHGIETTVNTKHSSIDNVNDSVCNRKDVVNLLLPPPEYQTHHRNGVTSLLQQIMAGSKRNRRNKTRGRLKSKQISRAESCKEMPLDLPPEMQHTVLHRSNSHEEEMKNDSLSAPTSELDLSNDVTAAFAQVKNNQNESIYESVPDLRSSDANPADFIKDIVLQNYAARPCKRPHVSLVYLSGNDAEKDRKHAEILLNEIAKSIDCKLEDSAPMGAADSKSNRKTKVRNDDDIDYFKQGLQSELDRIRQSEKESSLDGQMVELPESNDNSIENDECAQPEEVSEEEEDLPEIDDNITVLDDLQQTILNSPEYENVETKFQPPTPESKRKSNLKLPKSDKEAISDDERSESGKKKVTFRKIISFDDGDQQTDPEDESSYELASSDEESDDLPDNDELLGGVVVARNDDKVVITELDEQEVNDELRRLNNENSDSGFIENEDITNSSVKIDECDSTETLLSSESEDEEVIQSEESEEDEYFDESEDRKSLISQEDKFQNQVAQLTELANARSNEAEKVREQISGYKKNLEAKDLELEHIKCELEATAKESELTKQRSRSLEDELASAKLCNANLAEQLQQNNDDRIQQLRKDLETAVSRCSELEYKIQHLEQEIARLQHEKSVQEEQATEALTAAEASATKWRLAHESARSQAAARAERLLGDCEWKMRELERRARDAERSNVELTADLEKAKKEAVTTSHLAELQQLRGVVTEQQHSVVSLSQQLQRLEHSEECLKTEIRELKDLLEAERSKYKHMETKYREEVERVQKESKTALEQTRVDMQRTHAAARTSLERAHAERTRSAIATLRAEHEKAEKNADRKLREAASKLETMKQELESKQTELQTALEECRGRTDWELMQLRHLLDRADITYANQIENLNQKHEKEIEELTEEWSAKVEQCEEEAEKAAGEASSLLAQTKFNLERERMEQVNKLKEQHRIEMEEQWERFMTDKEECLSRMKLECKQEGDEEREKAERELVREIQELRAELASKDSDFGDLAGKSAAVGRTLEVTEQELREALEREKNLRAKHSEDATKIKQIERGCKDQIEHLTRKCACLKKLFDDIRARLATREQIADEESKAQQKEIQKLRAEVQRLTKLLIQNGSPLGPRTRADGCDSTQNIENGGKTNTKDSPPRKRGGNELKRRNISDTKFPLLPDSPQKITLEEVGHRKRANSVDLPAVQVPGRIKQLEDKIGSKLERSVSGNIGKY